MRTTIAVFLTLATLVPLAFAQRPTDKVFLELENRISHAVVTRNAAEMNELFASDYTSVGVSGQIRSRAEVIEAYLNGRLALSASQTGKMTVRQYGDIAVVVGLVTVSGTDGGTDISGRYAFTRVYKRDSGEWRAVTFQATVVK
jgi:ketosteroid isomerase-like protein